MLAKPKGTYDVYGEYGKKVKFIENYLGSFLETYNYEYVRTPIFESSELFHRNIGDTTDIVTKETYDFKDRGDRDLTLRPEGTAGVARMILENKLSLSTPLPLKYWYYGPNYRYERPQNGRFREFYQFGIEVYGSNDPAIDVEVIGLGYQLFTGLGLENVTVHLNTLGNKESREMYRKALVEYFKDKVSDLCEDCQERYQKNPLRILDCKVDADSDILKNAPKTIDYLDEESRVFFEKVKNYLEDLDINYVVDPKIVRGLDYYTHTIFEYQDSSSLALGGGGRYDNLLEDIGGTSSPAVGMAIGIERFISALEENEINIDLKDNLDCFIMYVNDEEKEQALTLLQELRLNGFKADTEYTGRSLKAQFKQGDRFNTKLFIIINSEDLSMVTVKDNVTKEEIKVKLTELVSYLDMNI